jgi:hypothetical protein
MERSGHVRKGRPCSDQLVPGRFRLDGVNSVGPTSHPPASAADRTLDEAGHLGSPSICWVEREVAR